MSKPFTLYWSSLETYENCPQKFLWGRGWGTIDLGAGPGKPKPPPAKRSAHDAFMGTVIAAVIERLYNDELWREPKTLVSRLQEITQKEFAFLQSRFYIDWSKAPPKEALLKDCLDAVTNYLRTMKFNKLIGPYAKSEVELVSYVDKYTPVGGRADLIVRRDDTGLMILDGKNSKTKGKYTNPDQLRWYALCFYLCYGEYPKSLGFIYFRYPHGFVPEGSTEAESGVDWVPYTKEDLTGIAERAIEVKKGMFKESFPAKPSPANCRFCDYETVCPERQATKVKRNPKPDALSDLTPDEGGFIQLGFGSTTKE